jgi:hypothetical protein
MADHIATRKSTFTSASASRKRRTHQPNVRTFGRGVSAYSKPEKSKLMANQKQAEECVLYVRVSTTRQAEDGVSIDAQIAKGKLTQNFAIYCFLMRIFSSMTE